MTNRRLQKEMADMMTTPVEGFSNLEMKDDRLTMWEGLVVPDRGNLRSTAKDVQLNVKNKPPYNNGAFRVTITFPDNYPFVPPKITFKTKIYHPNIDENGAVCLNLINTENWKPATKIAQVIQALIALVNSPEPDHALKPDIAEMFSKDKPRFMKTAESHTKKHAEKRPKDKK